MPKILRPGLVAIRYKGKIDTLFRGAVEEKKYITVSPEDIVIVSLVDSITYTKGTQWEKVETEVDISSLLDNTAEQYESPVDTDDLSEVFQDAALPFEADEIAIVTSTEEHEKGGGVDDLSTVNETEASKVTETQETKELREATLENINDLHLDEVKQACKKFGIKYGKKKIEDLIPLLLPFLNQEND